MFKGYEIWLTQLNKNKIEYFNFRHFNLNNISRLELF